MGEEEGHFDVFADGQDEEEQKEDEKEAAVQNGPKGKVGKEEEARRKRLREHPLTGKFWRQLDTYDAGLQRQEKLHQIIGMLKERRGNFQRFDLMPEDVDALMCILCEEYG